MPQGLNFSTITVEPYEFTGRKGGRFIISDDLDTDLIIHGISAISSFQQLGEYSQESTETETLHHYEEIKRQIDSIFLAMVQHADPDVTDDDIKLEFHLEDRIQVIIFFQNLLGSKLQKQPGTISALQTSTTAKTTKKRTTHS
jgi:hypothetical protein